MSWHFLQGQEEASWAGTCLDGAPSALSSMIPTPEASSSPVNATDAFHDSRCGMTCEPSTGSHGEAALTSSQEDSHARTYPSQGDGQDSRANEPDYSGTHSLSQRMSKRDGSSWRMSPDFLRQIRDAISEQSQLHWATQGFTTLNGGCLIRSSSESPNVDVECSLSQVLQPHVDDRYLLSEKAASGILRRSERRGKKLPEPLRQALLALATTRD